MRPENTLPGFEYAIRVGADALEMDVAVTRDDVVVVSHDPKMNPLICRSPDAPRAIRQLTLAELQRWDCGALPNPRFPKQTPIPGARVPTLDQVLDLADRGDFLFNIEVKSFPDRPALAPPRRVSPNWCTRGSGATNRKSGRWCNPSIFASCMPWGG